MSDSSARLTHNSIHRHPEMSYNFYREKYINDMCAEKNDVNVSLGLFLLGALTNSNVPFYPSPSLSAVNKRISIRSTDKEINYSSQGFRVCLHKKTCQVNKTGILCFDKTFILHTYTDVENKSM